MSAAQTWSQVKAWLDKALGVMLTLGGVAVGVGLMMLLAKAYGQGRIASLIGYSLSLEQTVWLAGGLYLLSHARR